MNKRDFADQLSWSLDRPLNQAQSAVDEMFKEIAFNLLKGESILIDGVGRLRLEHRPGFRGRNPRTGEPLEVPPGHRLRVTVSRDLKRRARERDVTHEIHMK